MKNNKAGLIIIFSLVLLFVISVFIGNHYDEKNRQGECVKIVPPVCVGGSIYSIQGFFSSGPDAYYLWFKGETDKSKEECRVTYRVTESQYDKWMMEE